MGMESEKVKNKLTLVLSVEAAVSSSGSVSLPTAKMATKRPKKVARNMMEESECRVNTIDPKLRFI